MYNHGCDVVSDAERFHTREKSQQEVTCATQRIHMCISSQSILVHIHTLSSYTSFFPRLPFLFPCLNWSYLYKIYFLRSCYRKRIYAELDHLQYTSLSVHLSARWFQFHCILIGIGVPSGFFASPTLP